MKIAYVGIYDLLNRIPPDKLVVLLNKLGFPLVNTKRYSRGVDGAFYPWPDGEYVALRRDTMLACPDTGVLEDPSGMCEEEAVWLEK
jgi:hypothetical protein